jgi:hypothetical protein
LTRISAAVLGDGVEDAMHHLHPTMSQDQAGREDRSAVLWQSIYSRLMGFEDVNDAEGGRRIRPPV